MTSKPIWSLRLAPAADTVALSTYRPGGNVDLRVHHPLAGEDSGDVGVALGHGLAVQVKSIVVVSAVRSRPLDPPIPVSGRGRDALFLGDLHIF
jgi:hypothetical protein